MGMNRARVKDEVAARDHFLAALAGRRESDRPFRHVVLTDPLPGPMAEALAALPIPPASIDDTQGKRDSHNSTRVFFNPDFGARHAVAASLAALFQDPAVPGALIRYCGAALGGTSLRVEYCQDTDGFWLEPHTDIGAKKLTLQIYLNNGPDAESLGTDLYDAHGAWLGRAPSKFVNGFLFVPGNVTFHGFVRRPFAGVRRSVIVNYVGPEWRARHELAFPSQPVL